MHSDNKSLLSCTSFSLSIPSTQVGIDDVHIFLTMPVPIEKKVLISKYQIDINYQSTSHTWKLFDRYDFSLVNCYKV